jgi:hypothetical protein
LQKIFSATKIRIYVVKLLKLSCSFAYPVALFVPAATKNKFSQKAGKKEKGAEDHCGEGDIKPWIIGHQDIGQTMVKLIKF